MNHHLVLVPAALAAVALLSACAGTMLTMPVALGTVIYLWVDFANARVAFGGTGLMASWLAWLFDQPQSQEAQDYLAGRLVL